MKTRLLSFHSKFESVIVSLLLVLLMVVVFLATLELVYLLGRGIHSRITDLDVLETRMHLIFGGFLVILLGVELMETVRMYLTEHVIHVEVVFLVAMIAVGRHIIELDYLRAPVWNLFGTAAIVVALSLGYFLLKKSQPMTKTDSA
jgi:uncharacterized membrane protein (DUF373 family)